MASESSSEKGGSSDESQPNTIEKFLGLVLVGIIGGSGIYNMNNLTPVYVSNYPYSLTLV